MKEVTEKEFFAAVYKLTVNVHPSIAPGCYPYTSIWKLNDGTEFGRSGGSEDKYFLKT